MNLVRRQKLDSNYYTASQLRVINAFRQLWEQHSLWTRSFIISELGNLSDADLVRKRLLEVPTDFLWALQPFYGGELAMGFKNLFEKHLLIAAQIVDAAKAGDTEQLESLRTSWYANADEIADYLSTLNPLWNKYDWRNMLYTHLQLTENEIMNRVSGQYAADIALYDFIQGQSLEMADEMSSGLIKQFGII